jgi:hypothetical protein
MRMAEKKRTAEEIVANLKRARQEPQSEVIAFPATTVAPEWPAMDPAAYYGFAGEVVKTIGPHSEADPNAILLQLLTCAGSHRPHRSLSGRERSAPCQFVHCIGRSEF